MTSQQIVVVGGGAAGVCTAYFLAAAGHEVVVVERHRNVAQEGSLGHAGLVGSGIALPWATPDMRRRLLRRLLSDASPILLRPRLQRDLWRWARRWLKECELERYRINSERMQRIASYGKVVLDALHETYAFSHQPLQGVLQLFRNAADVKAAEPALALLAEHGISHHWLDAEGAYQAEPALSQSLPLAGAVQFPEDGAGNSSLFIKQMRQIAASLGVQFHFSANVDAVENHAGRLVLRIDGNEFDVDAAVLAAGIESANLLARLGIQVPVYPVRSYSVTATIKNYDQLPQGALLDEARKISIARVGNRIRVAGLAELGRQDVQLHPDAVRLLAEVGEDWFPHTANYSAGHFWAGARAMLPDGPPLLGRTPVRNLYVNFGHGTGGWGMAVGGAKVVADIICGQAPEIGLEGLTLARYG